MLRRATALKVEPLMETPTVDEDIAQFMQRTKNLKLERDQFEQDLHRTQSSLVESERHVEFLQTELKKCSLDRDVYHRQYIALHTELTGLVQDADNFRETVTKALNRSQDSVRAYGTEQRTAVTTSELSDDTVKKIGEKFGAGHEGDLVNQ